MGNNVPVANNVAIEDKLTQRVVTIESSEWKTVITEDKLTGTEVINDSADAPPSAEEPNLDALELKNISTGKGGKITGILCLPFGGVIFFTTSSPGCYWYWNRRKWIWR